MAAHRLQLLKLFEIEELCWTDTCCIDRSSSVELSEAINSVFLWYGESSICYVYMSDVSCTSQSSIQLNSEAVDGSVEGGHLQELISPTFALFVNSFWQELGSQSALSVELEMATGHLVLRPR